MSDAKRDGLGQRMKAQYEDRFRVYLPRRAYTLIRVDGRAFHTLLRKADKPFDDIVVTAMIAVLADLMVECQGAFLGYCQSDEASIVLQDFADDKTEAWFDGNVQKIASISASIATVTFNFYCRSIFGPAHFDARCWSMADPVEVANYMVWRQKDWKRNAVQMVAQSFFSATQLRGKPIEEQEKMIAEKGWTWRDDSLARIGLRGEEGVDVRPAFDFVEKYDQLLGLIPRIREERRDE